jgi:hypothetical protein
MTGLTHHQGVRVVLVLISSSHTVLSQGKCLGSITTSSPLTLAV